MDPIIRAPQAPSQDRTALRLHHPARRFTRASFDPEHTEPHTSGELKIAPTGRGGPVANATRGRSEQLPAYRLRPQPGRYVVPVMTAIAALALAGIALHVVFA